MQNIQDLKEKIFFESKNIIDILEKINNVDELLSKQDIVDELANRISFLRLLEKNIEYFIIDNSSEIRNNLEDDASFDNKGSENKESKDEVTEEEAIFNNELNEIDRNENEDFEYQGNITEENSEESTEAIQKKTSDDNIFEETDFNRQLNEIDEDELSDYQGSVLSFVDEERILMGSEPENDEYIDEKASANEVADEEAIFVDQLNEINEFENEISDYHQGSTDETLDEEEKVYFNDVKETYENAEIIPSIFDTEIAGDEEILIEENEDQFITSNVSIEQGEMVTDTSNVENILSEIKNDFQIEEKQEENIISQDTGRRKIIEIEKPLPEPEKEKPASDESFENSEAYNQEKKIKLANIKGLKAVQSLFDDDPLEREISQDKPEAVIKADTGSLLKTNIPTDYMEAEKPKPEFKLDLNDRIAFSKTLFGGSQSELNEVVAELNRFKTLEEAKEYLSDLYYSKNWKRVDEYAQRLWILVENKFL